MVRYATLIGSPRVIIAHSDPRICPLHDAPSLPVFSIWLNGVEVTNEEEHGIVVEPDSVLEMCGLQFVFLAEASPAASESSD